MHPEDATCVSAVRAHFLSEAGGEAAVAYGKVLGLEPLFPQECCDGLLRSGDEVLLIDGVVVGSLAAFTDDLRRNPQEVNDSNSSQKLPRASIKNAT